MWHEYDLFALPSALLAFGGALVGLSQERRRTIIALLMTLAAALLQGSFLLRLWMELDRPPLRTMGEIRLWYTFFLLLAGIAVYRMGRFRWILVFTALMATVFSGINLLHPELHDQSLPPALQSPWFIPHVTVYMLSYAVMACAALLAAGGLIQRDSHYFPTVDHLVYLGTGLLFLGLLSGSLWAKQAWGDFWNWDPKETWAAVTACGYLTYIHLRCSRHRQHKFNYILVILSFLLLQMCWYGYLYLPSAAQSLHRYN